MENLFSILSTNAATTTNASNPEMGSSHSPQFSVYTPMNFFPTSSNSPTESSLCPATYHMAASPSENLPFPYTYSPEQKSELVQYSSFADPMYPYVFDQNRFEMQSSSILQPNEWAIEQEKRAVDALKTKLARSNRRLARQNRQRSQSRYSSSGASRSQVDTRRKPANSAQSSRMADNRDLYKFFPTVNKKLRFLVRKELRNSDVGSLGRIVLPKRDTEENLPMLSDKEGLQLLLRDLYSNQEWDLKFKYWSNNKSRMYVLENTGDFVKRYGLKIGDFLTLYEDEGRNLYFSIEKVERGVAAAEPSVQQQPTSYSHSYSFTPHMYQQRKEEEEDPSLALLIQEFNQKQQEATNFMPFSADANCSYTQNEELLSDPFNNFNTFNNFPTFNNLASRSTYCPPAAAEPMPELGQMGAQPDDQHIDDCYTGLDTLPDAYSYNFLL